MKSPGPQDGDPMWWQALADANRQAAEFLDDNDMPDDAIAEFATASTAAGLMAMALMRHPAETKPDEPSN